MAALHHDHTANPRPLLPIYSIDPPETITAIATFHVEPHHTYTFEVDARHSQDMVAFLDITIRRPPSHGYLHQSTPIKATVGKRANPIATVEGLWIKDTHGSPVRSDVQVRVYFQRCKSQ